MKIFFNTSVTGRKEYEEHYRAIDSFLKNTGHEIIAPVFMASSNDVIKETEKQANQYYSDLMKWIKSSDIFVFEVSYPSLGVGHEITTALQLSKPVIALYLKDSRPYVLENISDDRLQVLEYTLDDVETTLKDALDYATSQQDTRFNFFISPKHQNFLDWISKTRKVPRAVFLRRLIEEEMEKDEEYNS